MAELRATDRNERQTREERQRWIEKLEKECVVPEGSVTAGVGVVDDNLSG